MMSRREIGARARVCAVGVLGSGALVAAEPPLPVFVDATDEAGIEVTCGCPLELEGCSSVLLTMTAGGAAGDFDRDGRQDLFVLGGGAGPDRLYLSAGAGAFVDWAEEWGVGALHMGMGAAVGDVDGDGLLDIFVTSLGAPGRPVSAGKHRLYRNLGGSFVETAAGSGVATSSPVAVDGFGACFGDWDLDGDLDLVVAGWADGFTGTRLFENAGDGTFTDVTALATDLDSKNVRAFSPRLADMDGDHYPELLLAADFETSRYYRNNGDGTFTDVTVASGTAKEDNGMGATVADVDNDGRLDWFVTSIHGGGLSGNFLYWNQGDDEFTALGAASESGWAWGAVSADLNHDGWVDLAVTNGWSSFPDDASSLFVNTTSSPGALPSFEDVASDAGFDHTAQGRGLINLDADDDGDQDIVVLARGTPTRLYRNDTPDNGAWLRVFLDTSAEPGLAPDGIGAIVRATASGLEQTRIVEAGCNHLSQSELSAHFGLSDAEVVEQLRVEWPNGRDTVLLSVPAGQTLTLAYCPADADGDGLLSPSDFAAFHGAFLGEAGWTDANGDDRFDVLDFLAFQAQYLAGCP